MSAQPRNYLALSIVTLLCCCLPFGLVALIYSIKVDSAWSQGEEVKAKRFSNAAKWWNVAGMVIGIILIVGVIAFVIAREYANV